LIFPDESMKFGLFENEKSIDPSISQWEIRLKHWNIGPLDNFPYVLLIQL
jgi:hypothetical protein